MAKKINIPDNNNILRHIKPSYLKRDHHGIVIGVFPDFFRLREKEKAISVNWIEFFNGGINEQVKQAIADFKKGYNLKKSSYFAKINVGDLKRICFSYKNKIKVIHKPTKEIKSHSSVSQLSQDKEMLLYDISKLASDNIFRHN